ncbi:TetR/AcrR family transcriptional regulator [soil metagenome]
MARLSPENRRQAIIDAALMVARDKGLAVTTVRDVAAEMGTSSGLIHHYFDSMDEVLAEAFAQTARVDLVAVTKAVADAPDPVSAVKAFFVSYAPVESDGTFQLWLDAWSEATRRPALRETSADLNVAWKELVEGLVRSGVEVGVFRCPDPEAASWRIISLLDGLVLQVVAHRTTITRDRMLRWAAEATEAELGLPAGTLNTRD